MREGIVGTFNRREFDEARYFVSRDFQGWPADQIVTVLGLPSEGLGYDAFQRHLQDWVESWGDFVLEPKHVIDVGDSVLLLNHMRGQGPASGIKIGGQEEAQHYVFRSGRCVQYRQYWSWNEALESVGLSE